MIAPEAKIDDGFFDVINIGDIGTLKILANAYSLYRGTHISLPEVKSMRAKRVEIRSADGFDLHLETDGELPGKLPAMFEIIPKALKVRLPA